MKTISILVVAIGTICLSAAAGATATDGEAGSGMNRAQLQSVYSKASSDKIDVLSMLKKTLLGNCYTSDHPDQAVEMEFAYVIIANGERARPVLLLDQTGYVGFNANSSAPLTSRFSTFTITMKSVDSKTLAAEISAQDLVSCNAVVCQSGPSYCEFADEE